MKWNKKISAALEARHWSGRTFAKLTGVGYRTIMRWLQEESPPKPQLDHALRVAQTLGASVEDLFDDSRPWPPPQWQPLSGELVAIVGQEDQKRLLQLLAAALQQAAAPDAGSHSPTGPPDETKPRRPR